jgi:hypothetical protein
VQDVPGGEARGYSDMQLGHIWRLGQAGAAAAAPAPGSAEIQAGRHVCGRNSRRIPPTTTPRTSGQRRRPRPGAIVSAVSWACRRSSRPGITRHFLHCSIRASSRSFSSREIWPSLTAGPAGRGEVLRLRHVAGGLDACEADQRPDLPEPLCQDDRLLFPCIW